MPMRNIVLTEHQASLVEQLVTSAREVALDPAGKVPKRQVSSRSGSRASPFSIPF